MRYYVESFRTHSFNFPGHSCVKLHNVVNLEGKGNTELHPILMEYSRSRPVATTPSERFPPPLSKFPSPYATCARRAYMSGVRRWTETTERLPAELQQHAHDGQPDDGSVFDVTC
jgi:hypothetical protein